MLLTVLSAIGLVFVLNGLRPLRVTPVLLPAFFAAWLTVELAPPLLLLTLLGVGLAAWLGGVSWLGLLLAGLVVAGLLKMVADAQRVEVAADQSRPRRRRSAASFGGSSGR